jgi:hypothetical protein
VPVSPDLAVRLQTYLTAYRTEGRRSNVRWLFPSCNASGIAQPAHSPRTSQHEPKLRVRRVRLT